MTTLGAPAPAQAKPGRVWFAQGLRGLACLTVVVMHLGDTYPNANEFIAPLAFFPPGRPVPQTPWLPLLHICTRLRFSPADFAVAIFFLVSGFVIPFSLARTPISGFVARRLFRIYPTLGACLLVTVVAFWIQAMLNGTAAPYGAKVIVYNLTLLAPYRHVPWIEPVLWTLAVEELFYVIAALMAWRGLYGRRLPLLAAGVACTALAFIPAALGSPAYWLTLYLTFVPFLFIGTVLHHLYEGEWQRRDAGVVGGALFGLWMIGMYAGPDGYQATVFSISGGAALVAFALLAWFGPRVPYSRALDVLSQISYPLYLLHAINGFILMNWIQNHHISFYVALPFTIAAAIGGAVVVHYAIEKPAIKLGRRVSASISGGGASHGANVDVDARA